MRVFIDGIFDLFHIGHLKSFEKTITVAEQELKKTNKNEKVELIVGVIGDNDALNYKRKPVIPGNDRKYIIESLSIVNKVIYPSPLIVSKQFLEDNNIDLVVHGFSNKNDFEKQKHHYQDIIDLGIFRYIEYHKDESTTNIINKCKLINFSSKII